MLFKWISLLLLLSCSAFHVNAQVQVTFSTNIERFLENHEFNPDADRIELIITSHSLFVTSPLLLTRSDENPNVFKGTINFPERFREDLLKYMFRLTLNRKVYNEEMPRVVRIRQGAKTETNYFNSYAW